MSESINKDDFANWFVRCAHYCIVNYICPVDYRWSLNDCAEWRRKYELGMTVQDACMSIFKAN